VTDIAMNVETPARYVATELDEAPKGALSVSELAAGYTHPNPGDESRVPAGHNVNEWFVQQGIIKLGAQVELVDGLYRLTTEFDKLRYNGKKLHRYVHDYGVVSMVDVTAIRAKQKQDFFSVDVVGSRGGFSEQRLRFHALASAFPGMGDEDFLGFLRDVRENGVSEPLLVWGDEVLDGRHRLLAAYQLGLPVRLEKFNGTEDEARSKVWSANVERRHLNTAQKGLLVREWFLPQAEEEAAQRQAEKPNKGKDSVPLNLAELGEAPAVAAQRSGVGISPATIRNMAPVDNAPQTKERIRNGEIATASAARKEALQETGKPITAPTLKEPLSQYKRLGRILGEAQRILDNTGPMSTSSATSEQILNRCNEIEQAVNAVLKKIRSEHE
jgi:ParB-like chromosome segregation protein Spo0J